MVTVAVQFVVGRLVMRRLQDTDSSALSLHHELQLVHKVRVVECYPLCFVVRPSVKL